MFRELDQFWDSFRFFSTANNSPGTSLSSTPGCALTAYCFFFFFKSKWDLANVVWCSFAPELGTVRIPWETFANLIDRLQNSLKLLPNLSQILHIPCNCCFRQPKQWLLWGYVCLVHLAIAPNMCRCLHAHACDSGTQENKAAKTQDQNFTLSARDERGWLLHPRS